MNPFISSIYQFAGNFAIRGFALCAGQLFQIRTNTALFSLIGTYYGGNGQTTFGLPDLRGRTAIAQGQATGLSSYTLGEALGTENVTMTLQNMAGHNHLVNAITQSGSSALPANSLLSEVQTGSGPHKNTEFFYNAGPVNTLLNPASVGFAGSGIPFNIQQPILGITVMIATTGIFPARN